jgi:hypothetical protein
MQMTLREIITDCADGTLQVPVVDECNFSMADVPTEVLILMNNVHLDQLLDSCILYLFSTGFYEVMIGP